MNIQEVLATAISSFLIIKFLFSILGWYSRSGSDAFYRKNLDHMWDLFHRASFFELGHKVLQHLVRRIRETVVRRRYVLRMGALIVLINLASLFIFLEITPEITYGAENKSEFELILAAYGWRITLLMILSAILIASYLDLFSILITWGLVKRAANAFSIIGIVVHIFLDIFIASIAVWWATITISLTYYIGGFALGSNFGFTNYSVLLEKVIELFNEKMFAYGVMIVGASTCLPTLIYLFIALTLLALFLSPRFIQTIITKTIFLITTDKKPILSQLGNFFGFVSALIAALLNLF